jgi:hypothetical protein
MSATGHVEAACEELLAGGLPSVVHDEVLAVQRDLRRPLRLAVVGRVKSGKSTLVNALLGQRVARVDASECTRVVTSFSHGAQEKVVVHGRSGQSWTRGFDPDGFLPADLGAPSEEIASVEVVLCAAPLAQMTVIDTPGLDSLSAEASHRTEELLGLDDASRQALADTDVVLYCVPHLTAADDARLAALATAVGRTAASSGYSPATVLGVLSRADLLGGDSEDCWEEARALAGRYEDRLRGVSAAVVPVIGLLAEAADASLVTEDLAAAVGVLAALHPDDRDLLLLSADLFRTSPDIDVSEAVRGRLLELLGLHGLRMCCRWLDQGQRGAHALTKLLRSESGVDVLHDTVARLFTGQSDAIRAHRALVALDQVAYMPGAPGAVRDVVDRLRDDPAMQQLRERDVLTRWTRGELVLSDALAADLHALVVGTDPGERLQVAPEDGPVSREQLARLALDAASRWLRLSNDPRADLPTRRAGEVLRDSYTALWESLVEDA